MHYQCNFSGNMRALAHFLFIICFLSNYICQAQYTRRNLTRRCGFSLVSPNLRIVGGGEAVPHSWPWMLSLDTTGTNALRRKGHSCGAVLISAGWALTAAHCIDHPRYPNRFPATAPTTWRVTAGMHERGDESPDRRWWQVSGVRRFFAHYNYVDLIRSANNDIALLQLSHPFILTPYIQPICLPEGRVTHPGWRNCFTAGWGTLGKASLLLLMNECNLSIASWPENDNHCI
ncbi:chymotrypsin-like elastase family member 3B [Ciona intestinalis]